jgi:hypothetical protein
MIAGHFGFAAMVKSREQSTPLWLLMFAAVWLDVVFIPLFLAGIETIHPVAGRPGYGASVIYADYTHSLIGMVALSAILAGVCLPFWGLRPAIVAGLVSVSHWVLDLIVHRADIPVLPGNFGDLPRLGFGLWRSPLLSAGLEAILIVVGAALYAAAARAVSIEAGRGRRLATVTPILVVVCGLFILGLDLSAR